MCGSSPPPTATWSPMSKPAASAKTCFIVFTSFRSRCRRCANGPPIFRRSPGNIRQLENAVFRAVVLAEADTVGLEEFPQITAQVGNAVPSQDAVQSPDPDAAAAWAEDLAPALIPVAFHEEPHSGVAAALPPVGDALPLLDAEGEV